MKTKFTLLAAVILAGIGTSIALDIATPATDKPADMSCCAKMSKASAPTPDKDAPTASGMSCHSDAAATKDTALMKAKGCCK